MVNILVVTSYYSFLKCYHHGNWYTSDFSVLVLKTYSEFTMMSGRLSKWTNKQTTRSQIQLEHFALGSVSSKPGLWTKSSLRLKALRTMGAGGTAKQRPSMACKTEKYLLPDFIKRPALLPHRAYGLTCLWHRGHALLRVLTSWTRSPWTAGHSRNNCK